MDFIMDLWLPIVVSAVAIWIGSSLAWMALPHHKGDMKKLPNEDAMMTAVRQMNVPPGVYFFPHMSDCSAMKTDPVAKAKFEQGPHGLLQVWPKDAMAKMGRNMVLSFLFYMLVGVFVAYLASMAIPINGITKDFAHVFRFTGTAAIMAYCLAGIPYAIWFGTPLRNVLSCLVDGIAYGLITGAIFGWLWPGA